MTQNQRANRDLDSDMQVQGRLGFPRACRPPLPPFTCHKQIFWGGWRVRACAWYRRRSGSTRGERGRGREGEGQGGRARGEGEELGKVLDQVCFRAVRLGVRATVQRPVRCAGDRPSGCMHCSSLPVHASALSACAHWSMPSFACLLASACLRLWIRSGVGFCALNHPPPDLQWLPMPPPPPWGYCLNCRSGRGAPPWTPSAPPPSTQASPRPPPPHSCHPSGDRF